MTQYGICFFGRLKGAIRINYPIAIRVEADTVEAAKLKVYDTHEPYFGLDGAYAHITELGPVDGQSNPNCPKCHGTGVLVGAASCNCDFPGA